MFNRGYSIEKFEFIEYSIDYKNLLENQSKVFKVKYN